MVFKGNFTCESYVQFNAFKLNPKPETTKNNVNF